MTTMQTVKLLAWVEPANQTNAVGPGARPVQGADFLEFEGAGESHEQARAVAEGKLREYVRQRQRMEPKTHVRKTTCLSSYKPVQIELPPPPAAPAPRRLSGDLTPPLLQRLLAPLFR
jgi:hypothetical protein